MRILEFGNLGTLDILEFECLKLLKVYGITWLLIFPYVSNAFPHFNFSDISKIFRENTVPIPDYNKSLGSPLSACWNPEGIPEGFPDGFQQIPSGFQQELRKSLKRLLESGWVPRKAMFSYQ